MGITTSYLAYKTEPLPRHDLVEARAREVRYDMTPSPYDHLMERFRQLRVDTRELLLGDRLVVMES